MNIEAQRVERELRDELVNSISKVVSDSDRAKIAELEKNEADLRCEASKYDELCQTYYSHTHIKDLNKQCAVLFCL